MNNKINFILQLADNASIIGHRLSEWCGHGPILEQDIALTNIALDHIGRARSLYQYAAEQYNNLSYQEKKDCFNSVALQNLLDNNKPITEDDLAFLRDAWDFKNLLLVEQPNYDWGHTLVRSFFFDTFNYFHFKELMTSADSVLAGIAEKSLKEIAYHLRWSSEWIIRLGDGTEESHNRIQNAINTFNPYTGEMFIASNAEIEMQYLEIGANLTKVYENWLDKINSVLNEATIKFSVSNHIQKGGKEGVHTEHLGFILAEMQFMQRAYPNMEW